MFKLIQLRADLCFSSSPTETTLPEALIWSHVFGLTPMLLTLFLTPGQRPHEGETRRAKFALRKNPFRQRLIACVPL